MIAEREPPTVSVIIPVFNSSATIGRALESVLWQTFTDYEIVIVDDGSTDDLDAALQPYRDSIRLVRQANAGAAAARNAGAAAARGAYLAFLDADDIWHPTKLALQVDVFSRHMDVGYCCTGGRDIDRIPSIEEWKRATYGPVELISDFARVFARPYFGTPGLMVSRARFEQLGGYRQDLLSAEDIEFVLRAAYGRTIARIPGQLFLMIGKAGSLSKRRGDATYVDNLAVIDEFCRLHPEFAARNATVVRRVRARVLEMWGADNLVRGDLRSARSLFLRSLRQRISLRAAHLLAKAIVRDLDVRGGLANS